MRHAFVHEAVLRMEDGADPRGPGGAVTAALCGHWEHEGPCSWPHVSKVGEHAGPDLTLRVLFVAESGDAPAVRALIAGALLRGRVDWAPRPSAWTLLREGPDALRPDEASEAAHLGAG